MATYVVGDLQGCYEPLQRLLKLAKFNPSVDKIWFAGDLVNRGPENIRVLRFIKSLGDSAISVLGNHDLHLLAASKGARKPSKKDTIQDVLDAPDCDEILDWLRFRPLIHREGQYIMSHAGIPHVWTTAEALGYAKEVEAVLQSDQFPKFLHNMYGTTPSRWKDNLEGWPRLRTITNYLTRMRYIDTKGHLDFDCKSLDSPVPLGMNPWYSYPRTEQDKSVFFLFGHWAALDGVTGIDHFIALDTGCIWGKKLTMIRLEDHKLFQVPSNPFLPAD